MRCPYCAEKIQKKAIFCKHCKRELPPKPPTNLGKRRTIIILILVVIGICLLITLIANLVEKAAIARDPVSATINAMNTATQKAIPTLTKTTKPTETDTPTLSPTIDPELSTLLSVVSLESDVATHILNVIHYTGFENIHNAAPGPGPDQYSFDSNQGSFIAEIKADGLYKLTWNGITLYDITNSIGESVSAYILTEEDKIMYQVWVMENVKHNLVSPSTADFKYQWSYYLSDNKVVTVQSGVDSENAFGALIKNTFTAQFDHSTTDVLYFEISGTVIYGSPQ